MLDHPPRVPQHPNPMWGANPLRRCSTDIVEVAALPYSLAGSPVRLLADPPRTFA